MSKKFTAKMRKGVSIALLGIVVAAFLFISNAAGQPDLVEAATGDEMTIANTGIGPTTRAGANPVNSAGLATAQCVPANVGVYDERVHIKCAAATAGIQFFAKSTTDANEVARVLSVLTIAQAMGRTIDILYDPADTSGTAIGCQANDCRLILAVFLY